MNKLTVLSALLSVLLVCQGCVGLIITAVVIKKKRDRARQAAAESQKPMAEPSSADDVVGAGSAGDTK